MVMQAVLKISNTPMNEEIFGQKTFFCPSKNTAMVIIVVSLTCTAYHYSSFIMQ
jgi:hypothetical protein